MWELDCEESWVPKTWCFWTVVLEKTLESPLDCKEIQLVHPKANQSWVFIGKTDAEVETPILWAPHAKSWLIGKDSDAGRDWGQEEKGTTEYELAGWHRWLNGHEFEWTLGVRDGQGGLVCWDSWGHKESYTTEQLNWTVLLGLLLCPWTWGIFFWWDPSFSCWDLFRSVLYFEVLTGEDVHMSFYFAILKTCRLIPWGNFFHWYCFMGLFG